MNIIAKIASCRLLWTTLKMSDCCYIFYRYYKTTSHCSDKVHKWRVHWSTSRVTVGCILGGKHFILGKIPINRKLDSNECLHMWYYNYCSIKYFCLITDCIELHPLRYFIGVVTLEVLYWELSPFLKYCVESCPPWNIILKVTPP